jgi:predicted Zn-dependent protease
VVLALLLSACAARVAPIGTDGQAFTPDPDERLLWALADREAATLLDRVGAYDDPRLASHLASMVERVTPAGFTTGAGPVPRVAVLRDPTLAAFALPDGRVFVHAGLVAAVETESQLALVLARELGHVSRRHPLVAWRAGRVTAAPAEGVAPLSPTAAAILGAGLPVSATAALTGYGDGFEREADAVGLAAVARGGWDPRAAAAVWSVLARELAGRGALETFLLGRPAWLEARRQSALEPPGAEPTVPAGSTEAFETHRRPLLRDNAADELRRGRFALARRQLDRVLAAEPSDALAHVHYGDLHRLQSQRAATPEARDGQIRLAHARYTRALALDPALAPAHRQLGLLYYQQQRVGRARAALEEYLKQAPTAPDAARISEYARELGR